MYHSIATVRIYNGNFFQNFDFQVTHVCLKVTNTQRKIRAPTIGENLAKHFHNNLSLNALPSSNDQLLPYLSQIWAKLKNMTKLNESTTITKQTLLACAK